MKSFAYTPLGYPSHPALPSYALYEPNMDNFIVTWPSLIMVKQLRRILSGRYQSFVVCLNTADNYVHNLIDNSICEQWTLQDPVNLIDMDRLDGEKTILADRLCEASHRFQWDRLAEKNWCFLCLYWLQFLDHYRSRLNIPDRMVDLVPRTNMDSLDRYTQLEQQVLRVLYASRDLQTTHENITTMIFEHPGAAGVLELGVPGFD